MGISIDVGLVVGKGNFGVVLEGVVFCGRTEMLRILWKIGLRVAFRIFSHTLSEFLLLWYLAIGVVNEWAGEVTERVVKGLFKFSMTTNE